MSAEPSIRTCAARAALRAAALVVLAACGPSAGDPCEPDPDAPGIGFRTVDCDGSGRPCDGRGYCCEERLYCVGGSPGCGEDVQFQYDWVVDNRAPAWLVCGCDGATYGFDTWVQRARWRFYGSCDDCDRVSYGRGWYYAGVLEPVTPVNPACMECRDARRSPDADCVGADGSRRAADCCDCSYQLRDGEQVCVGVTGEVLEDACCDSR